MLMVWQHTPVSRFCLLFVFSKYFILSVFCTALTSLLAMTGSVLVVSLQAITLSLTPFAAKEASTLDATIVSRMFVSGSVILNVLFM